MMQDSSTNCDNSSNGWGAHWGELSDDDGENSEDFEYDAADDIEKAMNNFNLTETQFNERDSLKVEILTLPIVDPLVTQAIQLHKSANKIRTMIASNDNSFNFQEESYRNLFLKPKISHYGKNIINYIPDKSTDFSKGVAVELPVLHKTVIREILRKSVATLLAHIGYETSEQSALNVLTDVLQEFYKKIASRMKVAADDAKKGEFGGFPNIVERVLTETGMGGVKGINDYYQSRIVKYINVLQGRCKKLEEDYYMSAPKSPSPMDKLNKHVKVKVEEEDDVVEMENAEVHFAALDSDLNLSILEPGFQLLNSLEAETNLQGMLETKEEINKNSSKVASLTAEGDLMHPSPHAKKKRLK